MRQAIADRFDAWAWARRPVVVVGEPGAVRAQLAAFADRGEDFKERVMTIVSAAADSPEGRGLIEHFGLDGGARLTVLLIGKDTGVKLRLTGDQVPVTAQRLFDVVDAMPMRRSERMGP